MILGRVAEEGVKVNPGGTMTIDLAKVLSPALLISLPFVLAGKCGGAIRPGRFLTYSQTPHSNLLVSLMNAMDVPGNTFGNPAYCTGPLGNLT